MSNARDEILARVRAALTDQPVPPPIPRNYRHISGAGDVDRFVERVSDYGATVHRGGAPTGPALVTILAGRGIDHVLVREGFPVVGCPRSGSSASPWTPPASTR